MFFNHRHFTVCLFQASWNKRFLWLLLKMWVRDMRLLGFFVLRFHYFSILLHFPAYLNSRPWLMLSDFWYVGDPVLPFISLQRNILLFDILSCLFVFLVIRFLIDTWWFCIRFLEDFASHLVLLPSLRVNKIVGLFKFGLSHIGWW